VSNNFGPTRRYPSRQVDYGMLDAEAAGKLPGKKDQESLPRKKTRCEENYVSHPVLHGWEQGRSHSPNAHHQIPET
jgi:hypothetical protein